MSCPLLLCCPLPSGLFRCACCRYTPCMKKTDNTLPPEQTVSDLAHLAWCALMALHLAQQEGQAQSSLTAHAFLLRWLAGAQKQRRFPRSVAKDIDSLLRLGRQKGPAADLPQRLQYLWNSCTEPVSQQSELFRLTHAIEHLKSQGWVNAVVADEEWLPETLSTEYANTPALLVRKSELQRHFNEQGQQTAAVEFVAVGEARVAGEAFDAWELRYVIREQHVTWCILVLVPSAQASGDAVQAP